MSAENWAIWGGGGAKYFLSGPKRPPREGYQKVPETSKRF